MFKEKMKRWQYFSRSIVIMILSYVLSVILFEYYNFGVSLYKLQNVGDYEYFEYIVDYYEHRLKILISLRDAYLFSVVFDDFFIENTHFFIAGLILHMLMTGIAMLIIQTYWIICSAQRLLDIGRDPWLALVILVPVVKYLLFLYLSVRPAKKVLTYTP